MSESLLETLTRICGHLGLPVSVGNHAGTPAPDTYVVLVPLAETFEVFADELPGAELIEVRASLFTKAHYQHVAQALTRELLAEGVTITGRRYVGYEDDTKYHHWAVDAAIPQSLF
ncbi:hypothetical protein [Actinomyces minihominis]|uniref:hypothetical protein n=1 Tax=Actinomyces minihominis TaxID=2002838 RepID=UPI000C07DA60|nr:hypothetical protein [Actinomyces minihominis]